jgi:hypothetical protein
MQGERIRVGGVGKVVKPENNKCEAFQGMMMRVVGEPPDNPGCNGLRSTSTIFCCFLLMVLVVMQCTFD